VTNLVLNPTWNATLPPIGFHDGYVDTSKMSLVPSLFSLLHVDIAPRHWPTYREIRDEAGMWAHILVPCHHPVCLTGRIAHVRVLWTSHDTNN
jgi:hypothetical protein